MGSSPRRFYKGMLMMDNADIVTGSKIAGGIMAAGIAIVKFFSHFQTKGGCKEAHKEHDILDIERQKVRDEKLGRIHDTVERTEKLVLKMAGDFYRPRTEKTRCGDLE